MKTQLSILVCIAALAACAGDEKTAAPLRMDSSQLQTTTLEETAIERELRFDGIVEAINQATVAAQTSGRITELPFDVGDYVKQGDVIARITATEQKAQARAAQANLRAASAQLAAAQKQFARVKDLVDRKLMAQAEFDRAKAVLDSATAQANAAREGLTQAQTQADYTEIRAPYSGLLVKRLVDVGEAVSPGTPLMSGLSLERLRVVVNVSQQNIAAIRRYLRARVILPDGRSVSSTAIRVPPSAETGSHTFRLLVTLPEGAFIGNSSAVFPGMLVKVAFVSGDERRLLLPPQSLVQRAELSAAYIVESNGTLSLRYVRVGTPLADGRIPVLSGVTAGEKVALDPLAAGLAYRQRVDERAGVDNG